jgi:hypothetical protein
MTLAAASAKSNGAEVNYLTHREPFKSGSSASIADHPALTANLPNLNERTMPNGKLNLN